MGYLLSKQREILLITKLKIKKERVSYILLISVVIVAFFDAHIEQIFGIKRLPLPELLIVFIGLSLLVYRLYKNSKAYALNIIIGILLFLSLLSATVKSTGVLAGVLGTIWLYKSLIAIYVGFSLRLNENHKQSILKLLFNIGVISAIFTWIQFFYGPLNPFFYGFFNPFDFILSSSGIIGFMDNPNKNGFILLYALFYTLFIKKKNRFFWMFIFVSSILFAQSRQIIIILALVMGYYFIVVKKNYIIFATTVAISALTIFLFRDLFFSRFSELSRIFDTENYFRIKAFKIGMQVLSSNPFLGSGPGTFGGIVAHLTDSPIHEQYNLFEHWKYYRKLWKVPVTIDMYWPHLLVEVGVITFSINIWFYSLIYKKIKTILKSSTQLLRILFLIVMFMGIFSMSLESSYIAIPIFLLVGIDLHLHNKIRNETT